jgi:hypothetical protein
MADCPAGWLGHLIEKPANYDIFATTPANRLRAPLACALPSDLIWVWLGGIEPVLRGRRAAPVIRTRHTDADVPALGALRFVS